MISSAFQSCSLSQHALTVCLRSRFEVAQQAADSNVKVLQCRGAHHYDLFFNRGNSLGRFFAAIAEHSA